MNEKLKEKIRESLSSVLPVTAIVLALSIFLVPMEVGTVILFFVGAVMLVVGMGMFQLGAEMAMEPLGEGAGVQIARSRSLWRTALAGVAMGLMITLAEPDLQVLSGQVPAIPNLVLVLTVAVGVGLFLAFALMRILLHIDLSRMLFVFYGAVLLLTFLVPDALLSVALDSGGVTTGPITVPFIIALGVGLSSVRSDKNASDDTFGLVALASVGPILAVMVLGKVYAPTEAAYAMLTVADVATMRDVAHTFARTLPHYAFESLLSLAPIIGIYLFLQAKSRRFPRRQRLRIGMGFVYTAAGLTLFLCGVNVGFAPVGQTLGQDIANTNHSWLLVPIGMLIGYFIVRAEPAIQVLNRQVQFVTEGAVSAQAMNNALAIGVSVAAGLAMLRVLTGLDIRFIILPGYILALILTRFVPKLFVGIAFDSGGVASGPMTSAFLLPVCIGACSALGGDVMRNAFGVVALVALTPLIAIQLMGVRYGLALKKRAQARRVALPPPEDDDIIIEIEEE